MAGWLIEALSSDYLRTGMICVHVTMGKAERDNKQGRLDT